MYNSNRSKISRLPSRGYYDKKTINQIIDEALYCHASFEQNNQPFTRSIYHFFLVLLILSNCP